MRALPRQAIHLAAVLAAPLLPGCGEPARYDVGVSWTFIDGRQCQEAAVPLVLLESGSQGADAGVLTYKCTSGQGGAQVVMTGVAGGDRVYAAAVSVQGIALYRGSIDVDSPPPAALSIALYYTGGR